MESHLTFLLFNIISVLRVQNQEADLLVNVASKLIPSEKFTPDFFLVELIFRPSILDNIFNWRVFDNDMQVLNFLTNDDTFKYLSIDEVTHDENLQDFSVINDFCLVEIFFEKVKPILNLVLRLEKFFDLQDKFRSIPNCKTNSSQMKYETINLGMELNPQTINLGIDCTPAEKKIHKIV